MKYLVMASSATNSLPAKGSFTNDAFGWLLGIDYQIKDLKDDWFVLESSCIQPEDTMVIVRGGTVLYSGKLNAVRKFIRKEIKTRNIRLSNKTNEISASMKIEGIAAATGTAMAGPSGFALTETDGTSISLMDGISIAGVRGTAKVGLAGLALAREKGNVSANIEGTICLEYFDKSHRTRLAVGYVGENDILPNIEYQLNSKNEFIPTLQEIKRVGIMFFLKNCEPVEFLRKLIMEPPYLRYLMKAEFDDPEYKNTLLNLIAAHKISE